MSISVEAAQATKDCGCDDLFWTMEVRVGALIIQCARFSCFSLLVAHIVGCRFTT